MDKIIFNQRVKHGRLDFMPVAVIYEFEDPDAAPYFKACEWADDAPADSDLTVVTITLGELDIDPRAVFADGPNKGKFVMPDRAAAAEG